MRSGWASSRPPRPWARPTLAGQLGRLDAAGPDHGAGQDLRAVAEQHPVGVDLLDAGAEAQRHADVLELRRGVGVGLVREGAEHDGAVVDEVDAGAVERRGRGSAAGMHVVDEVGDRAGRLDAGRPGARR